LARSNRPSPPELRPRSGPASTTAAQAPATTGLSLVLTLAGCSSSGSTGASSSSTVAVKGIKHLDVAAFATLAASPSTVVLDVRTPAEFAQGHLDRAQMIDFRSTDFDTRIAALDKSATYAVYCHSGNRSGQALERMKTAGFPYVADLSGGITAWTSAGHAVTTVR
jgi:rhodanese-related sulfurtransferase